LKGIVILRIIFARVSGDFQDLHATALRAFKVGKWIAKPEHHFAGDHGGTDFSALADSAVHGQFKYEFEIKNQKWLTTPSGD
jgi:hypothetical protein